MSLLSKLGKKYRCDKVDQWHTFREKTYFDIYETYLRGLKEKDISFLELGVRDGASLRVWEEYFPNAKIIGVDINPDCKRHTTNRCKVEIGSQGDRNFLQYVAETHGPFDVVLDDASHINELTLVSLGELSSHVKTGGLYIIEDLRNSYEDLTEDVKSWPGMHLNNPSLNCNNSETRQNLDNAILSIIKQFDYRQGDFESVHFHSQMVLLQK